MMMILYHKSHQVWQALFVVHLVPVVYKTYPVVVLMVAEGRID